MRGVINDVDAFQNPESIAAVLHSNCRLILMHRVPTGEMDAVTREYQRKPHSIIDRIVNTGDITILSHDDTTPRLELFGVPNPRPLFENLKQRVIAVKRQRGVIKMDTGA